MIKKMLLSGFLILFSFVLFAQDSSNVAMADTFRSNGKIYVVVAVILTILAGIVLYLVRLDRRLSRLEKNG
jgi:uncharacterized membrane protein YcjF (UPF0283 family)